MDLEEINAYEKAGKIASEVREFSLKLIKKDMKLLEIADAVENKIVELGGEVAFPVNLSINEIAAHYTPTPDDETLADGLLKIDFGVSIDGFIADNAFSVDLTENKEFEEMIKFNKEILEEVLESLNVNSSVKDIGNFIYEKTKESKFSVVKNLSGHSLGKNQIHAGLTISNYKNENNIPLKEVAFAIEPFLTTGVGEIYEGKDGEIYSLNSGGNVRDVDSRKVLKFIKEKYFTRPFCRRWLVKEGFKNINFVLSNMVRHGILHRYPVLIEKSKKPVSQFEHTILITDKVEVTTR